MAAGCSYLPIPAIRERCREGFLKALGRAAAADDASPGQVEWRQFEFHGVAGLDGADHWLKLAGDMGHQFIAVGQAHTIGGDSQRTQDLGRDVDGIFFGHGRWTSRVLAGGGRI